MPRNRELMRVFRDLELVEHLGSGMHRILSAYDSNIFHISEHFFEMRFPIEAGTPEVTRLVKVLTGEMTRSAIMALLALKDEKHFRSAFLQAGITQGIIEMTLPDKPNSRLQKYRLTEDGRKLKLNNATLITFEKR